MGRGAADRQWARGRDAIRAVLLTSTRAIPNGYGVGCRIASYGVLPDCDSLDLDQALAAVLETGCISLS